MIEASCTNSALSPKSALLSATTQTLNPIVPAAGTDERDEVRIVRCRAARQRLPPSAGAQADGLRVGIDRRISREHRAEPGVGRSIRDALHEPVPRITSPARFRSSDSHTNRRTTKRPWRCRHGRFFFGGSDGDRFRGCILPRGAIVFAKIPEACPRGRSGREIYQHPRPGKLSPHQRDAARLAVARGSTLRDVAADFGVSHQTVANIIRG